MNNAKILDYFCRIEGEKIVCVVRMLINDEFREIFFENEIDVLKESSMDDRLGC